ncbi:MAG: nucleotidyltransferase domain-containing protein [Rhodoferax sp.]
MSLSIQISEPDWLEAQRVLSQEVPEWDVWAFGSRARGNAKPYSDLDLAVMTTDPLPLDRLAALTHAFDASDMTIRVDVVDWSSISEAFRQVIAADKVLVRRASL